MHGVSTIWPVNETGFFVDIPLQRKWIKFSGDAVVTQTSDTKKIKASVTGSLLAMSDICPGFQLLIEDELPYLVDEFFSGI